MKKKRKNKMPDTIQILRSSRGLPVTDTVSRLIGESKYDRVVYGWHVDPSVSDPTQAVTYLADAVGMTPAAMGAESFSYGSWENAFFMPKPCMLRYDGTVAYYLDPNDYSKKLDGTPSDITDPDFEGNVMMEWPLIWYKFTAGMAAGEGDFYVSNIRADNSYHCWCNYDANGRIIKHFYTSAYFTSGTGKMRSLSGVQLTVSNGSGDTTAAQEIERALANNTTAAAEWYTSVYCDRMLINALLILISRSLDTQRKFGRGFVDYHSTATDPDLNRDAKERFVTGVYDDKGLFWGSTSSGKYAVKVFGIENWWGLMWNRTAGFIEDSSRHYRTKLTYSTADGTAYVGYNADGTGYKDNGISASSTDTKSWIISCKFTETGFFPANLTENGASLDSIGYNGMYFGAQSGSCGYVTFGASDDAIYNCGAATLALDANAQVSAWSISTMLSCKPLWR